MLTLRPTVFVDGYYVVVHEGRTAARILRMNSTARELWLWKQIGWGHLAGWPTS